MVPKWSPPIPIPGVSKSLLPGGKKLWKKHIFDDIDFNERNLNKIDESSVPSLQSQSKPKKIGPARNRAGGGNPHPIISDWQPNYIYYYIHYFINYYIHYYVEKYRHKWKYIENLEIYGHIWRYIEIYSKILEILENIGNIGK